MSKDGEVGDSYVLHLMVLIKAWLGIIEALASQKSVQIALILAVAAGFIVCYFSLEAFLGMLGVVMS